jgi:hypothetical protein
MANLLLLFPTITHRLLLDSHSSAIASCAVFSVTVNIRHPCFLPMTSLTWTLPTFHRFSRFQTSFSPLIFEHPPLRWTVATVATAFFEQTRPSLPPHRDSSPSNSVQSVLDLTPSLDTRSVGTFSPDESRSGSIAAGNASAPRRISAGAIVGIVLAVIVLLILIANLFFLMTRRQNSMSEERDIAMGVDMSPDGNGGSICDHEITLGTNDAIINGFVILVNGMTSIPDM